MRSDARTSQPARQRIVCPGGVLNGAQAESLLGSLRSSVGRCPEVEIDLSRVTDVDRSGAILLLDAYVATILRRGMFAISGVQPGCVRALQRFGVLDVVDVIDSAINRRPH